jgi:hypothetical protein
MIQCFVSAGISNPPSIVKSLAAKEGEVAVFCWYEGPSALPSKGAEFMAKNFFAPLYQQKSDAKLWLYSLEATNYKRTVSAMKLSTPIGEAINRINGAAIECIYASQFYQYCVQFPKESPVYQFCNEEMPKKKWLFAISENEKAMGKTVAELFENRVSLFDSIKEMDVGKAYSAMQYVEGYYLVQEAVRSGLEKGLKKIDIAFALPNDEAKYYRDFPEEMERWVRLVFGDRVRDRAIRVEFDFFAYGELPSSRPYIDKAKKAKMVKPKEIDGLFGYIKGAFFRDQIHSLNECIGGGV